MVTRTATSITLRSARPADAPRIAEFFEHLSDHSFYRRFSTSGHAFSAQEIAEIADPDPDAGVTLVAVERDGARDHRIVGLGQLFGPVGAAVAEGALVVADSQQRHGLGSVLSKQLLRIARERRIGTVWALVQTDNHCMLSFARKFGFPVARGELGCELRVPVQAC